MLTFTLRALDASCILDLTVSISISIFIDWAVFSSTLTRMIYFYLYHNIHFLVCMPNTIKGKWKRDVDKRSSVMNLKWFWDNIHWISKESCSLEFIYWFLIIEPLCTGEYWYITVYWQKLFLRQKHQENGRGHKRKYLSINCSR